MWWAVGGQLSLASGQVTPCRPTAKVTTGHHSFHWTRLTRQAPLTTLLLQGQTKDILTKAHTLPGTSLFPWRSLSWALFLQGNLAPRRSLSKVFSLQGQYLSKAFSFQGVLFTRAIYFQGILFPRYSFPKALSLRDVLSLAQGLSLSMALALSKALCIRVR